MSDVPVLIVGAHAADVGALQFSPEDGLALAEEPTPCVVLRVRGNLIGSGEEVEIDLALSVEGARNIGSDLHDEAATLALATAEANTDQQEN